MPEGVEIPIKLKDLDKAQKDVDKLRGSVKGFFDDMKKTDQATASAISASASAALSTLGGIGGAGAYAFGASGGGFQQGITAAAKSGVAAIPGALTAAGAAAGPLGATLGMIGGSALAGRLDRAIDMGDFQDLGIEGVARRNARGRVAQAAGVAGMFGVNFSDQALNRALNFAEAFEQRGYTQSRRVLDMQIHR